MNNVLLLLGGDLGNLKQNFTKAEILISDTIGHIQKKSSLFESKAWGFDSTTLFLNQVLQITTLHNAQNVLKLTQDIEKKIGRKSKTKDQQYSSRLIDIDILFFNDAIINEHNLIVPHPRLHLRNFTLEPLNEIAPHFIHPLLNKSIAWLLANSKDSTPSYKI